MLTRRRLLQLTAATALPIGWPARASAQTEWQPSKPIEFIVMAGKGGGADLATRFLIETIAKNGWCPVQFTVNNLPGNSGLDAMKELDARPGNEHTLLFTLNSFYTSPLNAPQAGIEIARFAPIARLAEDNFLLWVSADRADVNSLEEFVVRARGEGPKWVMGGTGRESEDQLLTDFLNATYGLKMSYQSFGGGGEVARKLVEGVVHSTVNNPSEAKKLLDAGKVKPLASFAEARLPEFRAIPSLRETGMNFTYFMQRSVVGPPGLPEPALNYYVSLFERLYDSIEWQTYRRENSLFGNLLSGGELMAYWLREREKHQRWLMAMRAMRS